MYLIKVLKLNLNLNRVLSYRDPIMIIITTSQVKPHYERSFNCTIKMLKHRPLGREQFPKPEMCSPTYLRSQTSLRFWDAISDLYPCILFKKFFLSLDRVCIVSLMISRVLNSVWCTFLNKEALAFCIYLYIPKWCS